MPRTRKEPQLRREEILRTAVALIEKQGIPDLRIADIARARSVSPALIVYHFGSKENLVAEAFMWAAQQDLDRLAKLTADLPTPLARLRTALAWYMPTGQARGWSLWIEGWAAALREPVLRQVGRELDLRWKEALTAIIQDGVLAGELRAADPRGAAWRITAVMDGLAVQTVVHGGVMSREQVSEWARQIAGRELGLDAGALQPPPG